MTIYLLVALVLLFSSFNESLQIKSNSRLSFNNNPLRAHAAPTGSAESLRETVVRALDSAHIHKKISLLGSTGSIGTQTLDICREYPGQFEIVSMAAGGNLDLLAQQIIEFKPRLVSIREGGQVDILRTKLKHLGLINEFFPEITYGNDGIIAVATYPTSNTVVTGIVGVAGLLFTFQCFHF